MTIVDAHQHFWELGRADCHWPTPALGAIHRSFGPQDLLPLMADQGVAASVLVQSQAAATDTEYLLDLAAQHPSVKAVVGWADLKHESAPQRIRQLARFPKLRGLRPMLESLQDDRWITDPALSPAVSEMKQQGLSLDALVQPHHLPHLYQFARQHPDLPIVVDHGAKPCISGNTPALRSWRSDLQPLARLPNLYCKLSGLVTEASGEVQEDDLYPYIQVLVELFGPERLMWGSDWPVVNLNGDYHSWLTLARRTVARVLMDAAGSGANIDDQLQAIFATTACRFYQIPLSTGSNS